MTDLTLVLSNAISAAIMSEFLMDIRQES